MSDEDRKRDSLGLTRCNLLTKGAVAGGALIAGAVSARAAGPDPLITEIQDWNRYLGDGVDANPYGMPSQFESNVVRRDVAWLTADAKSSVNFTPLHELDGMITPNGLCVERHHGGIAEINPAECHGAFGEGKDRWPVLAGGHDSLAEERPQKTIGSYRPYLSTVVDYVKRTMPFGNARSLTDDKAYALTACLMYLNDIISDEEFELNDANFLEIRLPNEENFISNNRAEEPRYAEKAEPCMIECKPGPATVTMQAMVLDVNPGSATGDGRGAIE